MSSVPRILQGLPPLPGNKVRIKKINDYIFTSVKKPNGDKELSIVQETKNGRKLLKCIFENERGSDIYKAGKYHVYYDKRSGRVFDKKYY